MINRVITGKGIGGLLKYVTHDKEAQTQERAQTIDSNLASQDVKGMTKEFSQLYKIRESIGKDIPKDAARHFVLSLPPNETLSDEKWKEFGTRFLQEMGYINKDGEAQTLYHMVRHNDTDKDHLHIVTSRIKFDGKLVDQHNEQYNAEKITTELEKEFGLSSHKQRPKELGNTFKITLPSHADEAEFKREVKAISGFGKQTAKVKMLAEALGTADVAGNKWLTDNIQFIKKDDEKILLKFKNNMSVYLKSTDTDGQYTCSIKANKEFTPFVEEFKKQLGSLVAVEAVATPAPPPQLEDKTEETPTAKSEEQAQQIKPVEPSTAESPLAQPEQPVEPSPEIEAPPIPPVEVQPVDENEASWKIFEAPIVPQQEVTAEQLENDASWKIFDAPAQPLEPTPASGATDPADGFQQALGAPVAMTEGQGGATPDAAAIPSPGGEGNNLEAALKQGAKGGGGGEQKKPSTPSNQFPHISAIKSPSTAGVDAYAVAAGMDGSIMALLTQIAHLLSIIMQGNHYEAVTQRAKVQDQIKALKAQVIRLEQAEADIKNKNNLNKHNIHQVPSNNSLGKKGGDSKKPSGNKPEEDKNKQKPFRAQLPNLDRLNGKELGMVASVVQLEGLDVAKRLTSNADLLKIIEKQYTSISEQLQKAMQGVDMKNMKSKAGRKLPAPKPTWVK